MKNIKYFPICCSLNGFGFAFAQNSYQSMNNTMTMQRQQMSVARESQRLGLSMDANHSKFIAPRQKEIDLFNRLSNNNKKKIAELEAAIAEK